MGKNRGKRSKGEQRNATKKDVKARKLDERHMAEALQLPDVLFFFAADLLQRCGFGRQCAIAVVHARPRLGSQVTVCDIISFCFVNNLSTEVENFEQPVPRLSGDDGHTGLSTITGEF